VKKRQNMKIKVLYEDNHLIAVFKPAGILVQKDKAGKTSLMDEVKKYLKEKYKKPGNVFLGLLHRIDQPVSGIVLFAKTSKGASRLSEQFRNHKVEKIYQAIVVGSPKEKKAELIHYLLKDKEKNKVSVFSRKEEDSQKAELFYQVISSGLRYSLLKIKIKTGRSHQIRAQLSTIGHPILGDIKYGAPFSLNDRSIALCAVSLSFLLPTKAEKMEIRISVPESWKKYL